MKILAKPAALLALLLLGACAGGESGGGYAQLITVSTLPHGADCEFTREGAAIAKVSPTPGTIRVSRSNKPIEMSCTKEGHDGANEKLVATSNGSNVAAFLFGGLIGLAVSASSGADNSYPGSVTVILNPKNFASVAQRDGFFQEMKELARQRAKELADKERGSCTVAQELCAQNVRKLEEARDQQIAALEQRRLQTPVAGSAVPPQTPPPAPAAPPPPAAVTTTEGGLAEKNPVSFGSVADRDNWVEYQRAQATRDRDREYVEMRRTCGRHLVTPMVDVACAKEVDAIVSKYNVEIARIEQAKANVRIGPALDDPAPKSFATVAERDAWADAQLKKAVAKRNAAVQAAQIKCGALYMETRCAKELAESSEEYSRETARIEKLRSTIPVRAAT